MNGEHRGVEMRDGPDRAGDGVRDVMEFEVQEERNLVLGDPEHALFAIGAEEFEPELQPAGMAVEIADQRAGMVNIGGVDGDENRVQARGSSSGDGSGRESGSGAGAG